MKTYIIDASVVLTYSLEKSKAIEKKLRSLFKKGRKQIRLIAPGFIYVEVANGLRFSLTDKARAQKILENILGLPISLVQLKQEQYSKILELAFVNQATAYDTAYHYLAIIHNADFLTFDKQYYNSAKHLKHIQLLD